MNDDTIEKTEKYGAHNSRTLPVVVSRAKGVWVWDTRGKKYIDMLSGYGAVSQGHCHPKITQALMRQAKRATLISRAYYNDQLGQFLEKLCTLVGKDKALLMNSGSEAVETAIKIARKWGLVVKRIPDGKQEMIVCQNNYHGRTITLSGLSTGFELEGQTGFAPFTPGFKKVKFGDALALQQAISPSTAALLVEPIQGEGGVIIPPTGYLGKVKQICSEKNVLLLVDEVQTGFGRTGKLFACDWDGVKPDIYIVGKALSGGCYPISAVLANDPIMEVIEPGTHGSTYGGNPLAAAVGIAALEVIEESDLVQNSLEMGKYFLAQLRLICASHAEVKDIRGKGLMVGMEVSGSPKKANDLCLKMIQRGVLAKDNGEGVIRFLPPLTITKTELDWCLQRIRLALE